MRIFASVVCLAADTGLLSLQINLNILTSKLVNDRVLVRKTVFGHNYTISIQKLLTEFAVFYSGPRIGCCFHLGGIIIISNNHSLTYSLKFTNPANFQPASRKRACLVITCLVYDNKAKWHDCFKYAIITDSYFTFPLARMGHACLVPDENNLSSALNAMHSLGVRH